MFKVKNILLILTETPMHVGSGSDVGIVDLPIQREQYTKFPKIEGSSLKGAIREAVEEVVEAKGNNDNDKKKIQLIFGPEERDSYAGAIGITDAKILLFPVKSLKGVFTWITSPMILERWKQDMKIIDKNGVMPEWNEIQENSLPEKATILLYDDKKDNKNKENGYVVLEEYTIKVKKDKKTTEIAKFFAEKIFQDPESNYWKRKLEENLLILNDNDFRWFVESSTEVITRTKIDSATGTVQTGALWTEEYLPSNTILYSTILFSDGREQNNSKERAEDLYGFFKENLPPIIPIGGNQTIGKGLCQFQFLKE